MQPFHPNPDAQYHALLADAGGTRLRFGVASWRGAHTPSLEAIQMMAVAEHASFGAALASYRQSVQVPLNAAVFSIAGPGDAQALHMTNVGWLVEQQALQRLLGMQAVYLLNDLEAAAYSVSCLTERDLCQLAGPTGPSLGRKAMLGVGTGLGVAGVAADGLTCSATESGHTRLSCSDAQERRLEDFLMATGHTPSWESVLSGPGLCRLYGFMRGDNAPLPSAETILSRLAIDAAAVQAVELFVKLLARYAGETALAQGAWAGVCLTGGLLRALKTALQAPAFKARFVGEGVMASRLAQLPVWLVEHDWPGLLGAARFAQSRSYA